jgi:hypothetical protein
VLDLSRVPQTSVIGLILALLLQHKMQANVAFGSLASISPYSRDVRLTSDSDHKVGVSAYPLRANNGHSLDVIAKCLFKSVSHRGLVNPLPEREPIPLGECI